MEIIKMEVGPIGTNCYIAYDAKTLEGIVIDPGGNDPDIIAEIEKRGLKIKYIVNTHGHWDHIGANDALRAATGAPLLIHEEDAPLLADSGRNLAGMMRGKGLSQPADTLLKEGDTVDFSGISLQVIHTPGHTKGGICLYEAAQSVLFSGDTLFQYSIGRTDFPGGSLEDLLANIKAKLLILPGNTLVYPGHGPSTTIAAEKHGNSFLA